MRSLASRALILLATFLVLTAIADAPPAHTAHENPDVLATITVGQNPNAIGVNPDTNRIYVSDRANATVFVIDGGNSRVIDIDPGTPGTQGITVGLGPFGIGVNASTNRVYVANEDGNTVSVIDIETGSPTENTVIATIDVPVAFPRYVAVNPNTNCMYVSAEGGGVAVIDGLTNTVVDQLSIFATFGWGVGINPNTNKIYASHYDDTAALTVFSVSGGTQCSDFQYASSSVSLGSCASSPKVACQGKDVAVNASTNRIYVANQDSDDVSVINGDTDTLETNIPLAGAGADQPHGVGMNPSTNRIYVGGKNSNNVVVINGADNSIMGTVTVGAQPEDVDVEEPPEPLRPVLHRPWPRRPFRLPLRPQR